MNHKLFCLINEMVLMHLFVICEVLELLSQVRAKMTEDGPAINEFELLPLVLIRHFAGPLLRAEMCLGDAAIKIVAP